MKTRIKLVMALTIFLTMSISGCGSNPSTPARTTPVARPAPAAAVDELDIAIRDASDYLNDNIPKGSKIVILNIQSSSPDLSDYIIDELIANAVNDKVFTVVDRQQLDAIRSEQNFQLSGEVDDNDALAIGKFFGAQTIVSGRVNQVGDRYRMTIRALEVQTAQVQGQYNRNIAAGATITALMASGSGSGGGTQSAIVRTTGGGGTAPTGGGVTQGDYDQVIRLNPNDATEYTNRGNAYRAKNQFDSAIVEYDQAIKLNPRYAQAYHSRGLAYYYKDDYEKALADLNQSIRLDRTDPQVFYNRGLVYRNKNDFDRAITDYTEAIRLNPQYTAAYYSRGSAYYMKKDYNKAIADYETTLRLDPGHVNAQQFLELAQRKRN